MSRTWRGVKRGAVGVGGAQEAAEEVAGAVFGVGAVLDEPVDEGVDTGAVCEEALPGAQAGTMAQMWLGEGCAGGDGEHVEETLAQQRDVCLGGRSSRREHRVQQRLEGQPS